MTASTLLQRARRLLRHWGSSRRAALRAFPAATLQAIEAAISAGEQIHRAELRLIVETALPSEALWHDVSNRQRALALFAEHAIWDTEENCGILIYLNLAERKVDIVADRAVARKISAQQWQDVCRTMTDGFAQQRFHDSVLAAIGQLNELLRSHYPAGAPRANQLPDQIIML